MAANFSPTMASGVTSAALLDRSFLKAPCYCFLEKDALFVDTRLGVDGEFMASLGLEHF